MANPHRGEVDLPAGERTYTLVFRTNALAALQDSWGLSTGVNGDLQFLERVKFLPFAMSRDLRLGLWHALQAKHADEVKDLKAAGTVMDEAGPEVVKKALSDCLLWAFPEPPQDEVREQPPKEESPGPGLDS